VSATFQFERKGRSISFLEGVLLPTFQTSAQTPKHHVNKIDLPRVDVLVEADEADFDSEPGLDGFSPLKADRALVQSCIEDDQNPFPGERNKRLPLKRTIDSRRALPPPHALAYVQSMG
jgi:hypothetical protein